MNKLQYIPISKDKIPLVEDWSTRSCEHDLSSAYGVGIVCGKLSDNMEVIDIDCKYDLTGTLFVDYKELIHSAENSLLAKLVVQKTVNNGYHLIYRCKEIEGNKKLANRPASKEEKNQKFKVLIETRGEGGYFACWPTPGYEIIYGSLDDVKEITPEEREILFDCARAFNQVFKEPVIRKEVRNIINDNANPFDEWNDRGDVVSLLQEEGWKITREQGEKILMLRPGGTGKWSADFDTGKRLFYVFTSSTEFESEKAYNPTQVLTILKFGGDYSSAAKWLRQQGYGVEKETKSSPIIVREFIIPFEEDEKKIIDYRNGNFDMGFSTGFKSLDDNFVFKTGNFVCVNGHANIGKTTILIYLMLLSSLFHRWRWLIYSSENRTWSLRKRLMEFMASTPIEDIGSERYKMVRDHVREYFEFVNIERLYSAKELIDIASEMKEQSKFNGFLVDPYNALKIDLKNNDKFSSHEYHYEVASMFRIFANTNGISTFLNCHAVTESLRRKDKEGYPLAPFAEDTEGGGKFVNRADDFITLHRVVQHPDKWMETQMHVRKIKDVESGGKPTSFDNPFIIKMSHNKCGFTDKDGFDPIRQK